MAVQKNISCEATPGVAGLSRPRGRRAAILSGLFRSAFGSVVWVSAALGVVAPAAGAEAQELARNEPVMALPRAALPGTAGSAATERVPPAPAAVELPVAPSAAVRQLQLPAGITIQRATAGAVPLTLDQAIETGLEHNAGIVVAQQQGLSVRGQILTVENTLLPNLTLKAYSETQEIDLAALGFKPSALAGIMLPGFNANDIQQIVKINTSSAQVQLSQPLFDVPALFLFRAAKHATEATTRVMENTRGGVVLAIGGLYLQALAYEAQLADDQALVKQDQVVFDHAKAERDAGVGINLDVLRAQVDLENEQQAVIRDENAVAKDKIMLNREMGQPAGQQLELTDAVPFAEFTEMPLEEAKAVAFQHRKDLLSLEAQRATAIEAARAVKYQRLPTVGIGG